MTGGRGKRPPSQFDAEKVFRACLEHDVAVEINSRPERCDPPDEPHRAWPATSAASSPSTPTPTRRARLDMKSLGCERAERLGIPAERIVTTWPVDEVRAWAKG